MSRMWVQFGPHVLTFLLLPATGDEDEMIESYDIAKFKMGKFGKNKERAFAWCYNRSNLALRVDGNSSSDSD